MGMRFEKDSYNIRIGGEISPPIDEKIHYYSLLGESVRPSKQGALHHVTFGLSGHSGTLERPVCYSDEPENCFRLKRILGYPPSWLQDKKICR